MKNVQRCIRCIMDNSSDETIVFDAQGHCNYCTNALTKIGTTVYFPDEKGQRKLESLLDEVKKSGVGRQYDAIMGISGGLDSSYLAYLGYKWGLRILLVHIDDGFDTEISKQNLDRLVKATGFDYEVIKPDAQQYCALTKAYMLAGVPNIAIPQDNILFAFIYKRMRKQKIKYFLSGGNFALECILQQGNTHKTTDVVNIKDISKRFNQMPTNKLEFISTLQKLRDRKVLGIQTPRPLDYIDYNRERAFKELYDFCGFEYYGRKHLENALTAFIQLYWFPQKFGVVKWTSHLSSMIVSGQMTWEEALAEYAQPLYEEAQMAEYIRLIKEKLNITDAEFDQIMAAPVHQHTDYACEENRLWNKAIRKLIRIRDLIKRK